MCCAGLEPRAWKYGVCRSLQRLVCQHWALNMTQAATDSQWREGVYAEEFAEVEDKAVCSVLDEFYRTEGSTLTGWLQGNCCHSDGT